MTWPADEYLPRCGWKPVAGIAVVTALLVGGIWWRDAHLTQKAEEAQHEADRAHGRADAEARRAQALDAAVAAGQQGIAASEAEVSRLREVLARLRQGTQTAAPQEPLGALPGVQDHSLFTNHGQEAILIAQDALIAGQDRQIAGLKASLTLTTQARDAWKAAHDERLAETLSLRAALDAQRKDTSSALWRGRIQGLAVGIAGGVVIGAKR